MPGRTDTHPEPNATAAIVNAQTHPLNPMPTPRTCPDCSAANPAEARFCLNCGAKLDSTANDPETQLEPYLPKELLAKLEAARAGRAMEGERRPSPCCSATSRCRPRWPRTWTPRTGRRS